MNKGSLSLQKINKEQERIYQLLNNFKSNIMDTNQEINVMPRIGEKAPAFKAVTTQGNINFPADYEGKWIILFSHPADFTPVCTS